MLGLRVVVGGCDEPELSVDDRSTHRADPEGLAVDANECRLVALAGEAAPELDVEVRCIALPGRDHGGAAAERRPRPRRHDDGIGNLLRARPRRYP